MGAAHVGRCRRVSRLLQISDPHFGSERPEVVSALLNLAQTLAPDAIVLSGDITQRATPAQFAAAAAFCAELPPVPRLIVPGNHDIPWGVGVRRLIAPYQAFRRGLGVDLEGELQLPDCLLIGINSSRWWRRIEGVYGSAQVSRAAQRMRAACPDQLRIVVGHHPLAVPTPAEAQHVAWGSRRALAAFAAAGADLLLSGHIHLPAVFLCPIDPFAAQLWCVQAGTAVSRRTRAGLPNSVNLIDYTAGLAPRQVTVERWDFALAGAQFQRVMRERLGLLSR